MSGWFQQQIVHTGRLPLFCFFVALVLGFGFIRLSHAEEALDDAV
jgi:hypothetical protein